MAIAWILGIVFFLLIPGGIGITIWGVKGRKKSLATMGIAISVVFLVLFLTIPFSIHQVKTGEVAVVKHMGNATRIRTAGTYFDFWMTEKYEKYDSKVQQTTITTQTYSSDGQSMDIELVVQYQIQPDKAIEIATHYGGLEILQSRIETVSTEKMKSALSQKQAMKIIETRSEVSPAVEESIKAAITTDYYVDIISVVLTDISFTDAFEKTVEDKMIAEQEKLKAQYEKEKKEIEANAAAEVARIEAEAQVLVAKAQADAKIEAARGNAEAQKTIAQAEAYATQIKVVELARSLGYEVNETRDEETGDVISYEVIWGSDESGKQAVLQYLQYLEYLAKWNGELPDVVGDGSGFLITVPGTKN